MATTCPKCGRENPGERYTCAFCRASLPPQPVPERLDTLGGAAPPQPEAPPVDPGQGSLGAPETPERIRSRAWRPEPKPIVKKGRSAAIVGAVVGAVIGAAGIAVLLFCWSLVNRDMVVPGMEMALVAEFLWGVTMAAVAGAVVGGLAAAAGGGAITGAKIGAVLAAFLGVLGLAALAMHEGSLSVILDQVWRALVAVGAAAAFGGVIGAGAEAATERWA